MSPVGERPIITGGIARMELKTGILEWTNERRHGINKNNINAGVLQIHRSDPW